MAEEKRTEIADLGEFGLIDQITSQVKHYHKATIKGVGDDASVYGTGDELVVISSDLLIEKTHFDMT